MCDPPLTRRLLGAGPDQSGSEDSGLQVSPHHPHPCTPLTALTRVWSQLRKGCFIDPHFVKAPMMVTVLMSPPCVLTSGHSAWLSGPGSRICLFRCLCKVASGQCSVLSWHEGQPPHWSLDPACEACEPCADWALSLMQDMHRGTYHDFRVITCENGNKFS